MTENKMQASIVTALMPVTTTVPVTFIVLSEPELTSKTVAARTVLQSRMVPDISAVVKTMPQPKPRSVTVKARSLLKRARTVQKRRNSLLKPVITTQNKISLLKPVIVPPDKSYVNAVVTPQNKKSLLKPVIVPQGQDHLNSAGKTLKELFDVMKSSNNEPIDKFENVPKRVVRTVRPAKSLLKSAVPENRYPTISRSNLEEHAYVITNRCTSSDDKPKTTRKVFAGDITLEDFKTTERAKRSLTILKNSLKKSKEKLHSRHRRVSSSVGKVTDVKTLLLDLKSRNLITKDAYFQLDKAVNGTLTILKNNFQTVT